MQVVDPQLLTNFKSTFLSVERDQELIWRKLFVDSGQYSERLKRLLVINTPDCLDMSNYNYTQSMRSISLKDLKDGQYVRATPKLEFGEHEEVKSYVVLEFDDFMPSDNPEFRNCTVSFTIMCHLNHWEMDDYKLRPHQIAGYIDGLLNESRLTGIGTLQFAGASQIVLSEHIGGMILRYVATHGRDDDEKAVPELPTLTDL